MARRHCTRSPPSTTGASPNSRAQQYATNGVHNNQCCCSRFPAQHRTAASLPMGRAARWMGCLTPCSRTLGLRGAIFPSLPANLCTNARIQPATLSTGSTGTRCGGTQRSSVCQRPFFAYRLWQPLLFRLFSSFHPPSWPNGWLVPRSRPMVQLDRPRQRGPNCSNGARGRSTAMPVLAFLAVAGSALIALLFLADATLEKDASPVIVTSQRSGLPDSALHSDNIRILTTAPAPEPDMTLQAVRDAQPKPAPHDPMKTSPEARAARAEVPPQDARFTQPMNYQYRRSQVFDRFSIKGQ